MLLPFLYGLIACIGSVCGSIIALKGGANESFLKKLTALSGGMLISAAFLRILPASFQLHRTAGALSLLLFFLFLFALEDFMMIHSCPEYCEHCLSHTIGSFAFLGLSVHSLVDGIAVGSTFRFSSSLGLSASFAVIFHKLGDGLALSSLLLTAGETRRKTILSSIAIAIATLLGAVLSYSLMGSSPPPILLSSLLGISGASFIYVSTSDLLPELHRERELSHLIFLILGFLFILFLSKVFPSD